MDILRDGKCNKTLTTLFTRLLFFLSLTFLVWLILIPRINGNAIVCGGFVPTSSLICGVFIFYAGIKVQRRGRDSFSRETVRLRVLHRY